MQGKIQDCKSAFVVDENGNDIKISDRDEVNDLKKQVNHYNSLIPPLSGTAYCYGTYNNDVLYDTGSLHFSYSNGQINFRGSIRNNAGTSLTNFNSLLIQMPVGFSININELGLGFYIKTKNGTTYLEFNASDIPYDNYYVNYYVSCSVKINL